MLCPCIAWDALQCTAERQRMKSHAILLPLTHELYSTTHAWRVLLSVDQIYQSSAKKSWCCPGPALRKKEGGGAHPLPAFLLGQSVEQADLLQRQSQRYLRSLSSPVGDVDVLGGA